MSEWSVNCTILGVRADSSLDEIHSAYKKQVKILHPDKHNNNEDAKELFQRIQIAYEYLKKNHQKYTSNFHQESTRQRKRSAKDNCSASNVKQKISTNWQAGLVWATFIVIFAIIKSYNMPNQIIDLQRNPAETVNYYALDKSKVSVYSVSSKKCKQGHLFRIVNNSNKTLENVLFKVSGNEPNHSTVYDLNYGESGFVDDHILKPNESAEDCFQLNYYSWPQGKSLLLKADVVDVKFKSIFK